MEKILRTAMKMSAKDAAFFARATPVLGLVVLAVIFLSLVTSLQRLVG